MREDTTESEMGPDENKEDASAAGERRPSIVTLQSMLKKVSQSPFQNQYKTLVSSSSDSTASPANESVNKQVSGFLSDRSATGADMTDNHSAQNGVNGGATRSNPFYSYYLESGTKSHLNEALQKTSGEPNLDAILIPPPEFQSSPLDHQTQSPTVGNRAEFSNHGKTQPALTNGHFHELTQNSPDLFKPKSPPARPPLPSKRSVNAGGNIGDPFKPKPASKVDLFQPAATKLDNQEQSFQSSTKVVDVFSPSSTFAVDPFPSPITRNLFQDTSGFSDPFGTTPAKEQDPFKDVSNGTPDIFKPLPSKTNSVSEMASSPDLLKATPSDQAVTSNLSHRPQDIVLITPGGSEHDILQPSPFSRARNLSMTPSQSQAQMIHVQTFRRPPKPLPRTRQPKAEKPPRPEKPPKPEKPPAPSSLAEPEPPAPKASPRLAFKGLPKPVLRHKPKTPESKKIEPDDFVVFEDILLIGQEKCVEDWPEDSPQLDPDFKPSGTLRLRRESYKTKGESDGGSAEDQDGTNSQEKKKERKHRNMSLMSRRGSKDKYLDDSKEGKSRTLPSSRKSSKDYVSEWNVPPEETEDVEHSWVDYKKKQVKTKVNHLLRRASTNSSVPDGKQANGFLPQESKEDVKGASKKNSVIRRWSEGTVLDGSTGEEEDAGGEAQQGEKKKKKMKIKFVPHRGFAITVEKGDELKGPHGNTSRKGSKDKSQDEVLGAYGYTARKKSQDKSQEEVLGAYGYTARKKSQADAFENTEEMKSQGLQSTCKSDYMEDEELERALRLSAELNGDVDPYEVEDTKPKKSLKMKLLHAGRRSSKEDMLDDSSLQKKKNSFSAEELDDEELNGMDKVKKSKSKPPVPPRKPTNKMGNGHLPLADDAYDDDDDFPGAGEDFLNPEDMYFSDEDEPDLCKPKKSSKLKVFKKSKAKKKAMNLEDEDPPGATSGDFLSEAARAEWLAAQMDEQAMAELEDEDEEGDTDSLMEWWNTVEQWDEVPSDEEDKVLKEDESKSFSILADKVHRGLRVYNKVFTERAEVLWQSVITLHAIADDISTFHHKAKIAGITGGTTTAVGGVAAIAGLALAPITLGASLVITAVGVGVATAGGITSASAAISDNVNNMHDRKKVEVVLEEYETHLQDIAKILHFINQGLYKLRGHPFLRSGTQHYSKDWEIRRAVQMISLVDSPIMRATEVTDAAINAVEGLFEGMDKYFVKETRELKKGCKKEVVCQIKEVANVLNDGIVELNAIREELQDATGSL